MNTQPKITPEMIRLYDEYTHVTLDRRGFLAKLTQLAGSSAAAMAVLAMLENDYAKAALASRRKRLPSRASMAPTPVTW